MWIISSGCEKTARHSIEGLGGGGAGTVARDCRTLRDLRIQTGRRDRGGGLCLPGRRQSGELPDSNGQTRLGRAAAQSLGTQVSRLVQLKHGCLLSGRSRRALRDAASSWLGAAARELTPARPQAGTRAHIRTSRARGGSGGDSARTSHSAGNEPAERGVLHWRVSWLLQIPE